MDDDDGRYEEVCDDEDNPMGEMLVWASIQPKISSVRASISDIIRTVSSLLLFCR